MSGNWPTTWPAITASRKDGPDYTTFTRGGSDLTFLYRYELDVKPGDCLSAYSQVLYGNFKELDVFGRPTKASGGYVYSLADIEPIINKDLIQVGETLYHAPTVDAESRAPVPLPTLPVTLPRRPPPQVSLPRGMEIVAADGYDRVGFAEWITTFPGGGFVELQDIVTFVHGVQAAAGARKIAILHIQVHGYPGGMLFGDVNGGTGELLTVGNFATYKPVLARLTSHFPTDAWVCVRACRVGQNYALLRLLRQLWNVNILAGLGDWNNVIDFNKGNYVIFERTGAEYQTRRMPNALQHSLLRKWFKNQ